MIIVLKKKTIKLIMLIILILALAIGVGINYAHAFLPQDAFVVVLDAGHGGRDNGVIGVESKMKEKELNLIVTMLVKKELEKADIKVILTRESDEGLYGDVKKNFKKADMQKRKEIINDAKPDAVVSIHTNKFPTDSKRRVAQVFYEQMSENSKELAQSLQSSLNMLNKQYAQRKFTELKGDYYILKCSKYASAIVEIGFMSCPEEDRLLQQDDYRKKLAYQIASGIIGYLSLNTNFNNFANAVY